MADTSPKSKIFAGDSLTWTSSFPDYLANASWVANITFQKPGETPLNITATASGEDHSFVATAEQTALLQAGTWTWGIRVTKTTTAKVVQIGEMLVRPNPAAVEEETHNEKCLRLLQAAIENRLVDVQESISILGQDITKVPAAQLDIMLNRYQIRVNQERREFNRLTTGNRRRRSRIYLTG